MEEPPADLDPKKKEKKPRGLTHRISRDALMDAYNKAGLIRHGVDTRPPLRSDNKHVVDRQSVRTENPMPDNNQEHNQPHTSPKPSVPGTQVQHRITSIQQEIPYGQKCLYAGGTAVVSGGLLIGIWKGLSKWLG